MRNDLSSRIEAERQRREKERAERAVASPSTSEQPGTASSGAPAPAEGPTPASAAVADIGKTLGAVGSGIGSFFGSKYASLRGTGAAQESKGLRPMSLSPSKR